MEQTNTMEQQIDQLISQFKADLLALLSNKVEPKKEETNATNPEIDEYGTKRWYNTQGQLHRDEVDENGDILPAVIMVDGCKQWVFNGKLHRDGDKPAFVEANGDQDWWLNGKLHRADDKPAIVRANGDQFWFFNNNHHRVDDKPASVRANGNQEWWVNGDLHRADDKPAIIRANGEKEWWVDGKCVKKLLFKTD